MYDKQLNNVGKEIITHMIDSTTQMKEKTFCQFGTVDSVVLPKLIVGDGLGVDINQHIYVVGSRFDHISAI